MTRFPLFRTLPVLPVLILTLTLAAGDATAQSDQPSTPPAAATAEPAQAAPAPTGPHRVQVPGQAAASADDAAVPAPDGAPAGLGLAAMTAPAGAELTVALSAEAPRALSDRLRIARPGAGPEDVSGGEAMIVPDGPVRIPAPQEPGLWEMRYVAQGEAGPQVLEASPLTVVDAGYKSPRNRTAARP